MDKPTHVIISVETLEAVVNYLARRPWIEVHELLTALQQAQPAPEPPPDAD